ncbi:hypothetical protein M0R19_03890 [Candidatus Pacearchaeota archaeon]|jgi:viroplasmin and RNaseH domain-containing protein|nr:hypothetical protein [Candidatus Pacearchaeota archaeon]
MKRINEITSMSGGSIQGSPSKDKISQLRETHTLDEEEIVISEGFSSFTSLDSMGYNIVSDPSSFPSEYENDNGSFLVLNPSDKGIEAFFTSKDKKIRKIFNKFDEMFIWIDKITNSIN